MEGAAHPSGATPKTQLHRARSAASSRQHDAHERKRAARRRAVASGVSRGRKRRLGWATSPCARADTHCRGRARINQRAGAVASHAAHKAP
eukprot:CAMPEP_0176246826 /NCGR_PEP_ID=MMETSP0121_2-20121125/32643_1 /TAXON_ID=160619 /ORGANISM="Kryptoperidinium foliaceum, Strain CCMP 1326" /LENGTH=90 /DNA_ID=CAMNT_0017586469 /DNA_START=47 /DNA_END=316 /DNA_ORIENTATION=-